MSFNTAVAHRMTRGAALRNPRDQAGLTLIEFMVSITIGMIIVAALASLIAQQSSTRAEVERSGRLIENGRYALKVLANDVQMAGYWGELPSVTVDPAVTYPPNPCSNALADIEPVLGMHLQGFNSPGTPPACLSNYRAGTDILVIRHADPDFSGVTTAGAMDFSKVDADQIYMQSGILPGTLFFRAIVNTGSAGSPTFNLKKRQIGTNPAATAILRKLVVRIYYISTCSVCSGSDLDTKPTLKMQEITKTSALPNPITITEGIENMQIDYAVAGSAATGTPAGTDVAAGSAELDSMLEWENVMAIKIHLLARAAEATPGHVDNKTYVMGTAGAAAATMDNFKRHAFVQTVRVVNPSIRRAS